jgi:hypothetical protein
VAITISSPHRRALHIVHDGINIFQAEPVMLSQPSMRNQSSGRLFVKRSRRNLKKLGNFLDLQEAMRVGRRAVRQGLYSTDELAHTGSQVGSGSLEVRMHTQ